MSADLLRLATAGSVDDGKSTLVGRLLYDTKSVLADQLAHIERVSTDKGLERVDLSLLTDGLRAEREQGITIDVAYRYFATADRKFVLADTPGHVQYTRNMVTGASTAELAVILVDARKGVLEQTRRHAAVSALLGVRHLVVAVNKMDLVGFDEAVFRAIAEELAAHVAVLGVSDVTAIPLSALEGDNVVDRSARTPWYDGPTLLEHLENVPVSEDPATQPARFPVQYVVRTHTPDYRGYAGQVAAGVLTVGDEVVVLPRGQRATVAGIDTYDGPLQQAVAGQSVTVRLAEDVDVARGDLLAAADGAPVPTQDVEGTVCWLDERPLRPGARVLLRHGTRTVRAIVREVVDRLEVDTLTRTPAPGSLRLNEIGHVRVRTQEPLPLDDYASVRATGAFLLVDDTDGATLAAGLAGPPALREA
ncbi:MAG: sulfate adenylyltransferase subunit 1 [Motilibacteraceae bacterium]